MFLINLQNMEERKAFCNLAVAIINSDGKQEVKEIVLLQNFIKEMIINNDIALEDSAAFSKILLDDIPKEMLSESDIDKNLAVFIPADKLIKKTVLFELIGLAYVDLDFDINEKKIINHIAQTFGFSNELIKEMSNIIISLNDIVVNAETLVQD